MAVPDDSDHLRYPGVGILTLIWTFICAVGSLRAISYAPNAMRSDFIFWIAYVACFVPWGSFSAIAFRLERRFPLSREHWVRNSAWLLLSSIPVSAVAAP